MQARPYQLLVAAGVAISVLLAGLRHGAPAEQDTPIFTVLTVASLALSLIGMVWGWLEVHHRYRALASDKAAARTDAAFMNDRRNFQIAFLVAVSGLTGLAASQYGLNPFYAGLSVMGILALGLPVLNSLGGWTAKP